MNSTATKAAAAFRSPISRPKARPTAGKATVISNTASHSAIERLAIQPFGGLQYIYLRQNEFTETGAAAANLAVPGIDTHSFRSVLGTRIFGQSFRQDRSITPELRALWLHEFLDTETGFTTFFSGVGGGSFAINGLGLGRDWAVLGTGLKSQLTHNWSTYADYDLMLNDQTTFHIGSGGVQYTW